MHLGCEAQRPVRCCVGLAARVWARPLLWWWQGGSSRAAMPPGREAKWPGPVPRGACPMSCHVCAAGGRVSTTCGKGRPAPGLLRRETPAPPAPPPLCDIPSGCCSFTGPWTVTRSSLRMLRRVAAFCRPLRPVLLLVLFPRSRSPPPTQPPGARSHPHATHQPAPSPVSRRNGCGGGSRYSQGYSVPTARRPRWEAPGQHLPLPFVAAHAGSSTSRIEASVGHSGLRSEP